MNNECFPQRKAVRLPAFSYSENKMYFITLCTKDKKHTLGRVAVGYDACDVPYAIKTESVVLSNTGNVVEKYIRLMDEKYSNVFVDKYVVMPNHVHMLIAVSQMRDGEDEANVRVSYFGTSQASSPTILTNGTSQASSPTSRTELSSSRYRQHEMIPKFVSLFKRYCNHEIGYNIWQRSYYDHVVRSEQDYRNIWNYIENNPAKWSEDKYFCVDDEGASPSPSMKNKAPGVGQPDVLQGGCYGKD